MACILECLILINCIMSPLNSGISYPEQGMCFDSTQQLVSVCWGHHQESSISIRPVFVWVPNPTFGHLPHDVLFINWFEHKLFNTAYTQSSCIIHFTLWQWTIIFHVIFLTLLPVWQSWYLCLHGMGKCRTMIQLWQSTIFPMSLLGLSCTQNYNLLHNTCLAMLL